MNKQKSDPSTTGMSFRAKAILWSVISVVCGVIGGYVAVSLTAPFYFGFFSSWVLTGLVGMFVLAVHVTHEIERRQRK